METIVRDVAIVGAGISGLSLAFELQEQCSLIIIDSNPSAGGVIQTHQRDGFLLEYGPNTVRTNPELDRLLAKLGNQVQTITPAPHTEKKYLVGKPHGSLQLLAAPRGLKEALTTPLLTTSEKLRALLEPLVPRKITDDESVQSFIARRLGKAVADKLVAAILSGIWAGDSNEMGIRGTLPMLYKFEQETGSILRGKIKAPARTKPRIISFKNGMQELPNALAQGVSLQDQLYACSLISLERINDWMILYTDKATIHAKIVVLALPAITTATMLRPFAAAVADSISSIPYGDIGVLHLGLRKSQLQHPLDGFGFLSPPIYSDGLLGCLFSSSMFPNRCPEDMQLLTVFTGGRCFPESADVSNETTRNKIIEVTLRLLGTTGSPHFTHYINIHSAIPSYVLGHANILSKLEEFSTEFQQIRCIGNWKQGAGVADRISEASTCACKVLEYLAQSKSGYTERII